jgi:cytochrome c553
MDRRRFLALTPGGSLTLATLARGAWAKARSDREHRIELDVPILSEEPAYLKKALDDYAAGRRLSPEMEPYAKMAIHFGADDIARYFVSQPRQPTPIKADPAAVQRGRTGAAPCAVCHGADGKRDRAKLIPDFTGPPPGYLRNQLLLFKHDQRGPGEPTLKAAKLLIQTLPEETLADMAAYYSSVK